MKINQLFFDTYLKPATDNHREYVMSIYPAAAYKAGFVYEDNTYRNKLTEQRMSSDLYLQVEYDLEYYAWMWAAEHIGAEMLRKLEE
jgi:hypothetical protein